jgi:hypothetical protein
MPALDTVGKVLDYSRILLQDTIEPYRYPTPQLIDILNFSLLDARRLRPDLFLATSTQVPFYTDSNEVLTIDQQYRLALVYFIVGHAQLRDEEDVQDVRAAAMLEKFSSMLASPLMVTSVQR